MLGLSLSLVGAALTGGRDLPRHGALLGLYDPAAPQSLYKDAAMTEAVSADGDAVGAVRDLSGHGRHLTQASSAARPTYRTDGTLHWLEGDGTDDMLSRSFVLSSFPVVLAGGFQMLTDSEEGGIISIHTGNMSYRSLHQASVSGYQLRAADRGVSSIDARHSVGNSAQIAVASFEASVVGLATGGVSRASSVNTNVIGSSTDIRLFSFRDSDRWQGKIFAAAVLAGPVNASVVEWLARRTGVSL